MSNLTLFALKEDGSVPLLELFSLEVVAPLILGFSTSFPPADPVGAGGGGTDDEDGPL